MKIAQVSPYDWSYPGGIRNHVLNLASEFMQMGHEVYILAPGSDTKNFTGVPHFYRIGRTVPLPFNGSVARLALFSASAHRLNTILRHEQFDVIHMHEPFLPSLSLDVLRQANTLTVGTFHTFAKPGITSLPHLGYAAFRQYLQNDFKRLDGRIAVSRASEQFISRFFPADYQIIPNGVNLQHYNMQVPPFPDLIDNKKNILFVGRFEERKGVKYLLGAIPAIRKRYPKTRFIFVGEGSSRASFQRYVEQSGWSDILFTGYVSDYEKARYYTSSHVFCAPATEGESMGIVLLEAMASGTPVVASDIPGYATVVTHGSNGVLTPPRDSAELANAVVFLLENEQVRQQLVSEGLQTVDTYALPYVAQRVMNYYHQLLDKSQAKL